MTPVAENLKRLRALCGSAGIVGVTKGQPVERVREAVAAGITILGNNYAQEGEALRAAIGPDVRWHFIGHIQSRKAKLLTAYDCIESLDRISVAEELNKRVEGKISVLVEVNVGGEAQKSGISPSELPGFLESLRALEKIEVRGLMGMPPPLQPVEERRKFFRELKSLFTRHASGSRWDTLSMGTSDDFEIAVQEGATLVRLGTALFGPRV